MVNLAIRGSNYRYGYTKVDKEDEEEKSHREAQFLIYKTMKQVDQMVMSRRSSWLKLRICKLKVRIGNKLLSLRKSTMLCNMSKTLKVGLFRHLKSFKMLFNGGGGGGGGSGGSSGGRRDGRGGGLAINHLPPPLII